MKFSRFGEPLLVAFVFAAPLLAPISRLYAQQPHNPTRQHHPWDDKSLSPDERADLVIKEMTLDEKIQLVHGTGWGALREGDPIPARSNLGASFVTGIDRLGIPDINMADSAVGVRLAAMQSRYATLLPSTLGAASSWDPQGAYLYGSVIGRELRAQGYNMSIGGGVDITREPRNGRNFEYAGEDPMLAGTMTGQPDEGPAGTAGDGRHQALCLQRSGDRPNIVNAHHSTRPCARPTCWPSRSRLGSPSPRA